MKLKIGFLVLLLIIVNLANGYTGGDSKNAAVKQKQDVSAVHLPVCGKASNQTIMPTPVLGSRKNSSHRTDKIIIIIDDLGNNLSAGKRAIDLPGEVTVSILPYTYYSIKLANYANLRHKEVILHLPMQAVQTHKLGKGGLTVGMSQEQVVNIFNQDLASVPYVTGINNHMGSLFTQDPERMGWLFAEMRKYKLFFIDSRTTAATVAEKTAKYYCIRAERRDIFLDNVQTNLAIAHQFQILVKLAHRQGYAIAIGHPYPKTLAYLYQVLPILNKEGISLVPVSEIIK